MFVKVSDLESILGIVVAGLTIAGAISFYLQRVIKGSLKPINERIDTHMAEEIKGAKKIAKQMRKIEERQRHTEELLVQKILDASLLSESHQKP